LKNSVEREEINIPYNFVVESMMHAQVCTRHDIAFVVGILG
jgi:hypothetical protein